MIIQSDSFRSQIQNKQACHQKLKEILTDAEEACKPEKEPTKLQSDRVEGFKVKFEIQKKTEKIQLKAKKSSRNMKFNWKDL